MVTQVYLLCENTLRPTLIICMLFCMCIRYINKNFALKAKLLPIELLLKHKHKIKQNKKVLPCFCLISRVATLGCDVRVGYEGPS